MIGRMAPANPWIFRQFEQYVSNRSLVVGRQSSVVSRQSSGFERDRDGNREGHDRGPHHARFSRDGVDDFSRPNMNAISASALAAEKAIFAASSGAEAPEQTAAETAAQKPSTPASQDRACRGPRRSAAQKHSTQLAAPLAAPLYDEPTEADRYQMIRTYFQMLLEEGMAGAEGKMKQFASWFTHGVPGGAALRKAIYEAKTGTQILENVEEFFESRLQTSAAQH